MVVDGNDFLMKMAALILAIYQSIFCALDYSFFAIVCGLGVMAIMAIIPPSALFSYVVVTPNSSAHQRLTEEKRALRAGNYAVVGRYGGR